jgi:hypothetical protein
MGWKPTPVQRTVVAFVASIVLVVLIDLLAALTSPAAWRLEESFVDGRPVPDRSWDRLYSESTGTRGRLERSLVVNVRDERMIATWTLKAPAYEPLLRLVMGGRAEKNPNAFVSYALGTIKVAQTPTWIPESDPAAEAADELEFRPPSVVLPPGSGTAQIRVTSRPYELRLRRAQVTIQEPTVHSTFRAPTFHASGRYTVHPDDGQRIDWQVESNGGFSPPVSVGPLSFEVGYRDTPRAHERLVALGTVKWPIVGELLLAIMNVLPFLLLLFLLLAAGSLEGVAPWRGVVWVLVVWYLGVALLDAVLTANLTLDSYTGGVLSKLLEPTGVVPTVETTVGPYGLAFVGTLVMLPVTVYRVLPSKERGSRGGVGWMRLRGATAVALLFGSLAAVLVVLERGGQLASWRQPDAPAIVSCLAVAAIFLVSLLLVLATLGRPAAAFVAAVATLVFTTVALLAPALLYITDGAINLFAFASLLVLSGAMTVAFAILAGKLARAGLVRLGRPTHLHHVVWASLVVMLLVPTILTVIPPEPSEAGPWTAFRLAYAITWLTSLLGLGCLLLALHGLSEDPYAADRHVLIRRAGIVYVLYTFYWPDQHWLYVPVTLLTGWLLTATLLLPKKRVGDVAEAASQTRHPDSHEQLLKAALDPDPPDACRADRDPLPDHNEIKKRREKERTALGLSSAGSAWHNGWRGAGYGLALGAPWSFMYLLELLTGSGALPEGMLLEVFGRATWLLLEWSLYGFFFTYFYPYIRGDHGIHKGFWLFVTIVVPQAIYEVMTQPRSDWSAFGLWTVRPLVFSLALGLIAGDLRTLWGAGLGWSQVRRLHSLRYLPAWRPVLAIAGGATVATWIATGATLLSVALDQAQPSGPPPPPTSTTTGP